MKRIAVVGGGLSGLTVAYRLGRAGHDVTVFDAAPRVGGQLWTAREEGWVVELGAEGFVARSEAVPALATELGLHDQLQGQQATTSYRFEDGTLRALAPGEAAAALNFQVDPSARGAGIRTFTGGMQALSDALAAALTGELRLEAPVSVIEVGGSKARVDGSAFDEVVLATSSAKAARLLAPVVHAPALGEAATLSSVTVSLGFEARQIAHALEGTGFVVGEPFEGFRACTFTTSKFAGRAPTGFVSVRAFFRPTAGELETTIDWPARARRVLGRVLPIEGNACRAWTSVWPNALPVYEGDHRAVVARVEQELAGSPIHLVGSAFHGSGIDAAVRSAEAVAARLA